jgi:hypothetical protein
MRLQPRVSEIPVGEQGLSTLKEARRRLRSRPPPGTCWKSLSSDLAKVCCTTAASITSGTVAWKRVWLGFVLTASTAEICCSTGVRACMLLAMQPLQCGAARGRGAVALDWAPVLLAVRLTRQASWWRWYLWPPRAAPVPVVVPAQRIRGTGADVSSQHAPPVYVSLDVHAASDSGR